MGVWLEKSGVLTAVVFDGSDVNCYVYGDQNNDLFPEQTDPSSDTEPDANLYNGEWHHLVITTNPDGGKGYNLYMDSILKASSPYVTNIGLDKGYSDLHQ